MSTTPILKFDLKKIEDRMKWTAALADKSGIRILFAVKSFPAKPVLKLAAKHLHGFDVSNNSEYALIKSFPQKGKQIWISGPAHEFPKSLSGDVRIAVNSANAFALQKQHEKLALRVNATSALTGKDAGRFGVPFSLAQKLDVDAYSLHLGFQNSTVEDLMRLFVKFQQLSARKKISFLNLGGGWGHLTETEIKWLFSEIKRRSPSFQVVFEPGRWWSQTSGTALGKILDVREHEDGWDVSVTVSRMAHLKWSDINVEKLPKQISKSSRGKRVRFFGPTCAEDDKLIEIPGRITSSSGLVGKSISFEGVSGYSYAWNTGFNGFAPAKIEFTKGSRG